MTTASLSYFQQKIFLSAYVWESARNVVCLPGSLKSKAGFLYAGETRQGENVTDTVCVCPFLGFITSFGLSEAGPAEGGGGGLCFYSQDSHLHCPAGLLISGVAILKIWFGRWARTVLVMDYFELVAVRRGRWLLSLLENLIWESMKCHKNCIMMLK